MTSARTITKSLDGGEAGCLGRVLVVEDDELFRGLLVEYLQDAGFSCNEVATLTAMQQKLKEASYDAVVVDLLLEHEDGLAAISLVARGFPRTKVFIMSAHGTVEIAVDAMARGASSFISKSKDPVDIVKELKSRLGAARAGATTTMDETPVGDSGVFTGMVGSSTAIKNVCMKIEQFKNVDSTVLITGESGTGKELVARAIHVKSNRVGRFEALNCGAIPESLLESELFGHKRGAFTDAKADRCGIFERCTNGTLLLDEIGEMPINLQVKLLRVLQEKELTPIGGNFSIKVNTRVIAATNRVLLDEVRRGCFREDLYFRLAVLTLEVPPLRERRSDIPALARHFVDKFASNFGKEILPLSHEVIARLTMCDWPGNVRELQNSIERAVVLSVNGQLNVSDLFPSAAPEMEHAEGCGSGGIRNDRSLSLAKAEFEKAYLRQLLEATRGNISEMARISGRYRADIYKLLTKHGVDWEEFRG